MGFGSIIRNTALPLTKSLIGGDDGFMDNVTIAAWQGDSDDAGNASYGSPMPFQAIVVRKQQLIKKADGQEAMSQTYLAFLEELPSHGGANGRREPLDERDIITLSDGTTGPILNIEGLMDETTAAPFLLEVYLG